MALYETSVQLIYTDHKAITHFVNTGDSTMQEALNTTKETLDRWIVERKELKSYNIYLIRQL